MTPADIRASPGSKGVAAGDGIRVITRFPRTAWGAARIPEERAEGVNLAAAAETATSLLETPCPVSRLTSHLFSYPLVFVHPRSSASVNLFIP